MLELSVESVLINKFIKRGVRPMVCALDSRDIWLNLKSLACSGKGAQGERTRNLDIELKGKFSTRRTDKR